MKRVAALFTAPRLARGMAYAGVWVFLVALAFPPFLAALSRDTTFVSHQATIRASAAILENGELTLHTGPVIPDVKIDLEVPISVDVTLGKTETDSMEELVSRYAYLASAADGERAKLTKEVTSMATSAALRSAAVATLVLVVWFGAGRTRRRELFHTVHTGRGVVAVIGVAVVLVALIQPWAPEHRKPASNWVPIEEYVDGAVEVPSEFSTVEVSGDVTGNEAKRLVESMVSTYSKSQKFYDTAAVAAADLDGLIRRPGEAETAVLVVTDRHDNVGMDAVSRAIGDAAGATAVFNLGDDTSTGSSWESFSIDSVSSAFSDVDRWAITGNHDHGTFVGKALADGGWKVLEGDIVDGPGGSVLLGAGDPRSSGLGDWRDSKGKSISEFGADLADVACASERPITTLLVHDANAGKESLARGCVRLVLAGHTHLFEGPTETVGANGASGWSFTTGTTGGAAYAFALGSKPRREAGVSVVTYREGIPVGVQAVRLATNGTFDVDPWIPLLYNDALTVGGVSGADD